jgi:hypothetical protein
MKLHSNIHLTYYSYNNQKDLRLNLDRALGGQLIRIGYLLKITIEPIGNNRGLADRCALVVLNRGVSTVLTYWSRVVYFGLGSRLLSR